SSLSREQNDNNNNTSKRSYAFVRDTFQKDLTGTETVRRAWRYCLTPSTLTPSDCEDWERSGGQCQCLYWSWSIMSHLTLYGRNVSSSLYLVVSHWRNGSKSPTNVEVFLEYYGCVGLQTFRYSDIKKMANSFKDTLGQEGYGCVFSKVSFVMAA
ncbi:hypothetical protein IFM89_023131, partial [Coptis chinensis]